jgi:hypothetical protein
MTASRFALLLGLSCLLGGSTTAAVADPPAGGMSAGLPEAWLDAWLAPAMEDRPLQIVHGIPAQRATPEGMRYYADLGLGGLVCNVDFREYLQSEEHWKTLVAGVESCAALGMVVWLYDEEGYPSGAAGGLVLKENPAFEALEMAFDKSRPDPFLVRPAYEHTHASNNFHAARRYINLIDDRAVRCFIDKTHKAYWERLQPHFGKTIRAAFTDEPSLIAINIGQLPDDVRKKVRVIDPVDESLQPLPRAPWCHDLAEQYKKRYGEDLAPHRRSLFEGQSPEDRKVRTQFWGLIADLVAERYFGALQSWCRAHGIASSGHSLWEEQILHHVALEGNGLKCLARMDIPGLDLLNSDPMAVNHSGWLTAGLPASAAMLEGRRRVMTEVSDFSQKLGGQGPVSLDEMRAAAAWQAAWGVTEFTLYYDPADRPAESHRAYCDFVGRVNAIVKPARREAGVLLYYPIYDLWAEYLPVAEPLNLVSQSARARKLVGSFMRLGQELQRSQIPFTLTDHEYLASARTDDAGGLKIAGAAHRAILLPDGAELPLAAARAVDKFKARGGLVVADGADGKTLDRAALVELLRPAVRLAAPSDQIALGRFSRDGRAILLAANVGSKPYQGRLITGLAGSWLVLNPADGSHEPVEADRDGSLPLALAAHETTIWVHTSFLLRRSNP